VLFRSGGSDVFQFIIPAATPAGPVSRSFTNIPAGATCIVTEVLTGASTLVSVVTSGNPQQVTVPAAGTANVAITDSFDLVPVPPDVLPVQPTLPGTGAPGDWMYVTGVAIGMFILGATLVYVSRRRPARP